MISVAFYGLALLASIIAATTRPRTWQIWAMALLIIVVAPKDIRWWNQFHYWVGSKYHTELGLFDLYECTQVVRDSDGFRRDLHDYTWNSGPATCNAFEGSPERWAAFQGDVSHIDNIYYLHRTITDKGLNATPPWLAVGKPLANWLTPAQVALIDPLALLIAFGVSVWCVGWRRTGYSVLFIVTFYGTVGRIFGNYMQYVWLALSIAAVALLQRDRDSRAAGALIGVATALRIFPGALIWERGRRVWAAAIVGGTVAGVVGFSVDGVQGYRDMLYNMHLHSSYIKTEPLNVSLVNTVSLAGELDYMQRTDAAYRAGQIYSVPDAKPWWWALPAVLGAGWPGLLFGLVTVSRYYYTILAALIIERPELTRWLFGINALSLTLILFDVAASMIVFNALLFALFTCLSVQQWLPYIAPAPGRVQAETA